MWGARRSLLVLVIEGGASMAVFFIAHFGHTNIIKLCARPFADVEEMNAVLRDNWNARVKSKDDIYIVGDFWFKGHKEDALQMLKSMNGRKHLISGNHDRKYLNSKEFREQFVEIADLLAIRIEGERLFLSHYPIAEWDGYYKGTWHIYGHIHNSRGETFNFMKTKDRALNAGADITNFTPVTFEELKLHNGLFKSPEKTVSIR